MYRLRRNKDDFYVTRSGSYQSYSIKRDDAKEFTTRKEAEKDRCIESEYIESDY